MADHSLRHFDRYLILLQNLPVPWPLLGCQILLKIIFHVMGKMLCKIILVYYKLHRPGSLLEVLAIVTVDFY